MKKVLFMMMATAAITLSSCGNKNAQQNETTEAETEMVNADIENATADLAAQLEAGDVNKFQEALEAAKQKAAELLKENPEAAKEYMEKVQGYLKENTEKIQAVVGDNAIVSTAVSTLIETPAESIISNLGNALGTVETAAQDKADEMKQAGIDKANEVKENAEQKANEVKEAAKQKATDQVNEAANKVNEATNEAANKLLKGAGLK